MNKKNLVLLLVAFLLSGVVVKGQVNNIANHVTKDTLKISRDSIIRLILIKDSLLWLARQDSARMSDVIKDLSRTRDSLDQTIMEMIQTRQQDSLDQYHQYERNRWINRRTRLELKEPVNYIYEDSVKQTLADLISLVYEDTAFSPKPKLLRYSFTRLIHHLANDSIHFRIINSSQDTVPFVLKANRADSTAFFLMNTKQDSAKVFMRSFDRNTIYMWLEDDLYLKRLFKRQATPDRLEVNWQDVNRYRIARKPPPPDLVKLWNTGAEFAFYISQVAFSHWAKGGSNNIALTTDVKARANYAKGNVRWDNSFWFTYGVQKAELVNIRKSLDRIELKSNLSHKAFKKFDYNVGLSLISQSFKGYDYPNDSVHVSAFLAPGYFDINTGMIYRPNAKLTLNMSPAAGKFTMVLDSTLAKMPRYGNQGKLIRPEVGARVEIGYKTLLLQNVVLNTNLKLFSSYVSHPEKVDIDWTLNLDLKVNKYLTAAIKTQMMYDDDVLIPLYEVKDGHKVKVGEGKRLQIYEYIGIGFKYIL